MDADLELLLVSVFCTADDLLPDRRRNAQRRLSDAEVLTLCVAQVIRAVLVTPRAMPDLLELLADTIHQPALDCLRRGLVLAALGRSIARHRWIVRTNATDGVASIARQSRRVARFDHGRDVRGRLIDWPDIAACRAPMDLIVQYVLGDELFPDDGMRAAHERITTLYRRAGTPHAYTGEFYEGRHAFSREMQDAAFGKLERWARSRPDN